MKLLSLLFLLSVLTNSEATPSVVVAGPCSASQVGVSTIARGGGWFSDAGDKMDSSLTSAQEKLAEATKATKSAADKRAEKLEKKLQDERAKASKRLAKEQKRLQNKSDKGKGKLQAKLDEIKGFFK